MWTIRRRVFFSSRSTHRFHAKPFPTGNKTIVVRRPIRQTFVGRRTKVACYRGKQTDRTRVHAVFGVAADDDGDGKRCRHGPVFAVLRRLLRPTMSIKTTTTTVGRPSEWSDVKYPDDIHTDDTNSKRAYAIAYPCDSDASALRQPVDDRSRRVRVALGVVRLIFESGNKTKRTDRIKHGRVSTVSRTRRREDPINYFPFSTRPPWSSWPSQPPGQRYFT